jgi:hypothetical protein
MFEKLNNPTVMSPYAGLDRTVLRLGRTEESLSELYMGVAAMRLFLRERYPGYEELLCRVSCSTPFFATHRTPPGIFNSV